MSQPQPQGLFYRPDYAMVLGQSKLEHLEGSGLKVLRPAFTVGTESTSNLGSPLAPPASWSPDLCSWMSQRHCPGSGWKAVVLQPQQISHSSTTG
jgi:hypothetical protein